MGRLLRWTARIIAAAAAALVLLVVLALGTLMLPAGGSWAGGLVSRLLSSNDTRVAIGRIGLALPATLTLDDLALGDSGGTYLRIDRVAATLRLRRLLDGEIEVKRLAAGTVALDRLPASRETSSAPAESPEPPKLLAVDAIAVDRLTVGEAVLGERLAARASGALRYGRQGLFLRLDAERSDLPGGLSLALDYDTAAARLAGRLEVADPAGALATSAGESLPFEFRLAGDGPLSDWRGTLAIAARGRPRLAANITASAQGEAYHLAADGRVMAQDLVPAAYASLLGDSVPFALGLSSGTDGHIALDSFDLDLAAGQLKARGTLDPTTKALSGTVDLRLPDLAAFAPLLPQPAGGAGTAHLSLSGSLVKPELSAEIEVVGGRYGESAARRATAQLALASEGDIALPQTEMRLLASGILEGLTVPGASIPPPLAERLDWRIAARGDRAGADWRIDHAAVADGGVTLDGTAHLAADRLDGTAALAIADARPLGSPLAGSARLDVTFAGALAEGSATARLTGAVDQAELAADPLGRLLGRHLNVTASVSRAADGTVRLDGVELAGERLRLSGEASLSGEDQRLAGRVSATLPDLAAIGPLGGEALSGRASATATLSGSLAEPRLAARLDAAALAYAGRAIDAAALELDIAGLSAPAGRLAGTFRAGDLSGSLGTDLAASPDRVALHGLRLAAGEALVEGEVEMRPAERALAGTLAARIPDLARFSRLAGVPLAGRAEATARVIATGGETAEFSLLGDRLAVGGPGGARIEHVAAKGRLSDLLGRPRGSAEASLVGAQIGSGTIATASAKLVAAQPGRFHFDIETKGKFTAPVTIAAAGEASIDGGGRQALRLDRLEGRVADAAIALRRPLTLRRDAGTLAFADLALAVGAGRLAGSGRWAGESIALDLHAEELPVELAAGLAGHREISGRLGFAAQLSGTLEAPRGSLVLDGKDLRLAAGRRALPALAASARAEWHDERIEVRGRVEAPRQAAIGVTGSAPLVLNRPFAIAMPPQGRLELALQGEGELAAIADLLPIGDDRLAGWYALDARVDGTVAAPRAGGRFTVTHGRYESLASGGVLSNLELELAGDADRFVLRRLAAGDGHDGRLTGEGSLSLAAATGGAPPERAIDLRLALRHFAVVHIDDAEATASGALHVAGALSAPRVDADILVEKAELRIPDRLPASAPKLDVVRVGSAEAAAPPPGPATPPFAAALAIRVRAPGRVFVRGHGLDAEWRGTLDIAGTSAAPLVAGKLEAVRGTFDLLGKTFALTGGTVTLEGSQHPDPLLDIAAQASSSGILAQILIRGTGSAPQLTLTSQPPLPQDEVLSRLLFGTGVGQITPVQGLQLAQAAASLAGGGGLDVLATVRRHLGLDRLAIGSGGGAAGVTGTPDLLPTQRQQAGGASGTTTTLQAGKYLLPGVYVGVEQGAAAGSSAVRVEGEITPHVTIDAQAGGAASRGGESVGLTFKLDY